MHEGVGVTKILLTKIQLQNLNVFLLVFKRGYACAMIVQTNAIQFLPELFMNQFDTVCLHYGYTLNTCTKEFCSNKIIIDKRARKYQNDIQTGH